MIDQHLYRPFGNSEMAHRVRTHDWSASPLGPVEVWSAELKFAVASALENRFPTALVWGPDLVTIYNDAFLPILGNKPDALGQAFSKIWAEAWHKIGPITEQAFAGESTFIEDYPLLIDRTGKLEQTFFTFSYSPLRGPDGAVLGMIDTVVETTASVLNLAELQEKKNLLRESELRARTLVEDISQATWETDAALAVTDDGTGMTPEVKARVFEPFFTTKPVGQGTGLGLSQIYGFMRQSGGLVQIETKVDEGTTIRLCLPFHAVNPKELLQPPSNGKTLLLVEDEHDVRRLLADELHDMGYGVLQADTAEAAMRVISTGAQIDLLITDFGLRGGVNGRELAEMVRKQHANLPIIFITGFAGEETLSGEMVVRKPFKTAALIESVRKLLI